MTPKEPRIESFSTGLGIEELNIFQVLHPLVNADKHTPDC